MLHQSKENSSHWSQTRCLFKSVSFSRFTYTFCVYTYIPIFHYFYAQMGTNPTQRCVNLRFTLHQSPHTNRSVGLRAFQVFVPTVHCSTSPFPFTFLKLELSSKLTSGPTLDSTCLGETKHLQMPGRINPDWGLEEIPLPWHQNL